MATGLCTYALLIIACLLPLGLGVVQSANQQIIETEIFNKIWLELNTTPFYSLPGFPRFSTGTTNATAGNGLSGGDPSYFDMNGAEITSQISPYTGTPALTAASAIYIVRCTLVNPSTTPTTTLSSSLLARLTNLGPPVLGLGTSANPITATGSGGAGLNMVQIQIGFHIDPSTAGLAATDARVATRTYLIAKRDTATNGN